MKAPTIDTMNIGSLFSGIGGLELGLERAGLGPVLWQVEQDDFCRRVLSKHWPNADRSVADVRQAGIENLERVDIICGGFPCQDISYAGKGAGLAGTRSGLWFEFARIIGQLEPEFVVVENVSAIVSRGLGAVLGTLSNLGYDAVWFNLRASDVGAPHRRERLFIVAHSTLPRHAAQRPIGRSRSKKTHSVLSSSGTATLAHSNEHRQQEQRSSELFDKVWQTLGHNIDRCGSAKDVGYANEQRELESNAEDGTEPRENSWGSVRRPSRRQAQPSLGRKPNGLAAWVDRYRWPRGPDQPQGEWEAPRTVEKSGPERAKRLKALGNAVVPQCAEVVGWVVQAMRSWYSVQETR